MRALVACQIMKTLVCVLGQHQTGEQTRGFFKLRNFRFGFAGVLLKTFNLPNRLKIHLAISRVQIRKLTRQSFAEEITRDLARLIDLRQRKARQWQSGGCACRRNFRFDVVPTSQQFTPELLVRARPFHLIENELVIVFDRFDDLSKLTHVFGLPSCHAERSRGISNSYPLLKHPELSRLRST